MKPTRWWNRNLLPWAFTPWEQRATRCPKCWYDMKGVLPDRCPECGAPWTEPGDLWRDGRFNFGTCMAICLGAAILLAGMSFASDAIPLCFPRNAAPPWARIASSALLLPFIPILFATPYVGMWRVRNKRDAIIRTCWCVVMTWSAGWALMKLLPTASVVFRWLGLL